ncbi:uncharacterized protein FOMMEDRAFT_160751 [Fomitiporia mediterranea MF3/22]|uniref:uncharacterized protein n=1 Tax=Fomitiporia mediterranea (strain MF3/22) TaxID=694068 RepID=UPI000440766A|nr:uncharacterized protein FOMMEDRAFT_160751 [Fomitiporia mediterranea MF3/22]EJC99180.1 hypothetical protein FOMMEDRAFT_160751 [Fomitiporia mediterranea MF3/22]
MLAAAATAYYSLDGVRRIFSGSTGSLDLERAPSLLPSRTIVMMNSALRRFFPPNEEGGASLAAFEPSLASYIIPAAKQLKSSSPARQFEKLLLNPLSSAKGAKGPIIIIIDALDECGTAEQRREILELLKVNFANLPLEVQYFITSRPENDILRSLSSRPHICELKLEHTSTESRRDVLAYIDNFQPDLHLCGIRRGQTSRFSARFTCAIHFHAK